LSNIHLSPTPNNSPTRQASPPLKSSSAETIAMVFQGLDQQQAETICARSSTGWPRPQGLQQRGAAEDLGRAGPGTSGTLDFSRNSPESCLPTTARVPPKPMYSGRAIWRKRGRSYTATNLPGFPPRSFKPASRKISAMRCSRRLSIGVCPCMSTRPCRCPRGNTSRTFADFGGLKIFCTVLL
jgi:hypothetical protein